MVTCAFQALDLSHPFGYAPHSRILNCELHPDGQKLTLVHVSHVLHLHRNVCKYACDCVSGVCGERQREREGGRERERERERIRERARERGRGRGTRESYLVCEEATQRGNDT